MNNKPETFHRQSIVLPSYCDATSRLSINGTLHIFEDLASEHAKQLGIDGPTLLRKSNAFWVVTRTKVLFMRRPELLEQITLNTWPKLPDTFRCNRCYSITQDNNTLIEGRSEWVIIDGDTRHARKIETTCFPNEINYCQADTCKDFIRMKDLFGGDDFVKADMSLSTDIDFTSHTNNVAYCQKLLSCFPVSFFKTNEIKEFEIEYHNESLENEVLNIYRQKRENDYLFAIKKNDGTVISLARLRFEAILH